VLNRHRAALAFAVAPVLAIALAACGGSDDNSSSDGDTAAATTGGGSGADVSVQSVSGVGDVLVDSQGNALYTNDQDSGSNIACTGECTSIWPPLAAPSSGQPSSDDTSVQAKLGVVNLPDGTGQVSFDGKPLYSFVQDSSGQATGDGVTDSFGGTSFTWTVASTGGGSASSGGGAGTSTSGSSSSGGYGY
jgi:predicted lipoprotein with Yx(FWY)xxD motif